jgi:3',5'-cyclic AMP phosphodiesterase CpdA
MGPLYGSFDYGNSHFAGLDTTPVVDGKAQGGTIDSPQRHWLESDLDDHVGKAANLFVFMHHYVFGPPSNEGMTGLDTGFQTLAIRDDLHQLFRKYGVRAVFCGHAHLYWHAVKNGIDYFIAGNAGAPLEVPPEQGGFLGYMLIDVAGTTITTRALPAWTLLTRRVSGGDGQSSDATLDVSNYTADPITVRGITAVMPEAKQYEATASAFYKGVTKAVRVSVVGAVVAENGAERVTLAAELPWGRTTRIAVHAR